jgi:hypothetical protein
MVRYANLMGMQQQNICETQRGCASSRGKFGSAARPKQQQQQQNNIGMSEPLSTALLWTTSYLKRLVEELDLKVVEQCLASIGYPKNWGVGVVQLEKSMGWTTAGELVTLVVAGCLELELRRRVLVAALGGQEWRQHQECESHEEERVHLRKCR